MREVDELVGSWAQSHSREEVNQLLSDVGVPVAIVREVNEVVTDKHLAARGFIEWLEHEELGSVPLPHSPIRWTGSHLRLLELFHDLGADNGKVFGEMLGLSEEQLQDLKKRGII
jgi:formyl-CoA transferase